MAEFNQWLMSQLQKREMSNFQMKISGKKYLYPVAIVAALSLATMGMQSASADQFPSDSELLGSASSFGVIAAAAITNGGASSLHGDIGVYPGTAITGAATIDLTGINQGSLETVHNALVDLDAADLVLTNLGAGEDIPAELGGQIVTPGIYTSVAAFGLTGALTLSCPALLASQAPSDSIFIFKTPAALTTAAASSVTLDPSCNSSTTRVFWQLGAAATLGASSVFVGTILAQAAITTGAGVSVSGRLFSLKAAVTLDSTSIVVPN